MTYPPTASGTRSLSGMTSQAATEAAIDATTTARSTVRPLIPVPGSSVAEPRSTWPSGTSSSPPATSASSAHSRTGAIEAGASPTPRAGPSQAIVASSVDGENRIPMCSTPGIDCACRAVPAVTSPYVCPTPASGYAARTPSRAASAKVELSRAPNSRSRFGGTADSP